MASPDPFSILQQGAENTSRYFNQLQTGLLRTREFQVQQEQQAFQNDLALKGLALKEKDMLFDHAITTKKLEMASQEMNFDGALNQAKLQTEQARLNYWNQKAVDDTAFQQGAETIPSPIGQGPEAYSNWRQMGNANAAGVKATYPEPLQTVGAAAEMNAGSDPALALFDSGKPTPMSPRDWTDVGRGIQRMGEEKLNPLNQPKAPMAEPTPGTKTPFQAFVEDADSYITTILGNPKLAQGTKNQLVAAVNSDKLNYAQQNFGTDPRAKDFLNERVPEKEAIYNAVLDGDETTARGILNASRNPLTGLVDPVYAAQYSAAQQVKRQQKQQEQGYEQLERLLKLAELAPADTKEIYQKQARALEQKLFQADQTSGTGDVNAANSLIPVY